MVNVAFDESEFAAMKETLEIFEQVRGFSAHWLDDAGLREMEPRVSSEAIRALYTYGNATLTSFDYTLALAEAAKRSGAEIRTGEVTGLETDGNKVTGVKLADGGIACNAVVIASGPWSGGAASWLGVKIPVEPLAGEIVRVEAPGGVLQQDFSGAGASLYQRADGLVWVGATEVRRGFDDQPSEEGRSTLLKGAVKLMPCLKDARIVKQTACLRPVTPDWLPIIGKAPGWENAFLATGAGKKGILISPGIGKATADLIASGKTDLPITPFAPERFA
jgi:glycine/D-amino acid oxidase-like deaminating enzyme